MIEVYNTVKASSVSEIEMKKSTFIGHIFQVDTILEADNIILETRNKYKDASHNVPVYRVIDNGNIFEKASDDGEPSGTAGKPILDILRGKELLGVLIIVTRYFGGTLLGTGGLVKAYSDAAKKVIDSAEIIQKNLKTKYEISAPYELFNILKARFLEINGLIENVIYDEKVSFDLYISHMDEEKLAKLANQYYNSITLKEINKTYK